MVGESQQGPAVEKVPALEKILVFCEREDMSIKTDRLEPGLAGLYKELGRTVPVEGCARREELSGIVHELLLHSKASKKRIVLVVPVEYKTLTGEVRDGFDDFYVPIRIHDEVSFVMVGEVDDDKKRHKLHDIFTQENVAGKSARLVSALSYEDVGREILEAGIFGAGDDAIADSASYRDLHHESRTGIHRTLTAADASPAGAKPDEVAAPETSKAAPEKGKSKRGTYIGLAALGTLAVLATTGKVALNCGYDEAHDEFMPQLNSSRRQNTALSNDNAALKKQVGEQQRNIDDITKQADGYRTQVGSLTSENGSLTAQVGDLGRQVSGQRDTIASRDQQLSADATRISELAASGEQCNTNLTTCQGELQTAQAAATQATASGSAAPQQHCRYPGTSRCNYQRAEYRHSSDVMLPGGNRQPSSTGHRHR